MFNRKIALIILLIIFSIVLFSNYLFSNTKNSFNQSKEEIYKTSQKSLKLNNTQEFEFIDQNIDSSQLNNEIKGSEKRKKNFSQINEIENILNSNDNINNENNSDDAASDGNITGSDGNITGDSSFDIIGRGVLNSKQTTILKKNFEEQFDLQRGTAIHSIPERFKINIPKPIEASIVPQIIDKEKLFEQLKIQGDPKIIKDEILYSASGVDIKLKIDEDRFKIREVNTGIKPIISEIPELWIWEVTPLKKGNTNITLLVEIKLKNKQNGQEIIKYFPVFNELRSVDSNFSYSISKFLADFWKELATFLFGSGTFAGFVKWYIERRDAKKAEQESESEPEPESTRLIDKLKRKFLRRE